jgi:hypothetical protein
MRVRRSIYKHVDHTKNNLISKGGGSTETTHLQAALHPHLAQQSQLPQDMMQLVTMMTLRPKARERLDEAAKAATRDDAQMGKLWKQRSTFYYYFAAPCDNMSKRDNAESLCVQCLPSPLSHPNISPVDHAARSRFSRSLRFLHGLSKVSENISSRGVFLFFFKIL